MIPITDSEFQKLAAFIKHHYGIELKKEKKALVIGRLHKVLSAQGFDSFTEYYHYLVNDSSGKAGTELINRISTNHTYFMREAEHFVFFKEHVLPELKHRLTTRDLRIWCAASSTGEEPYTLAMFIQDVFKEEKALWDTKLLATDISMDALEVAKHGIYTEEQVKMLPNAWKLNYFTRTPDQRFQVTHQLKGDVIFRRFNLMEPVLPFKKKLHVIFCRNVMIYFDQETKDQLVRKMYDALEEGGYLFVGHSETVNREKIPFKYVKPSVYRK